MKKINYNDLNSRQKETYNFQKVSGVLADYGYFTIKLSDDWESADFIAVHSIDKSFLKVQLKGRLTFDKKYIGKDLFICFENKSTSTWYLYPHDVLLKSLSSSRSFMNTSSWIDNGLYSFSQLSKNDISELKAFEL
jgi:hypothetical protein